MRIKTLAIAATAWSLVLSAPAFAKIDKQLIKQTTPQQWIAQTVDQLPATPRLTQLDSSPD